MKGLFAYKSCILDDE